MVFLSGVPGRLYQEPEVRVDRHQRPAAAGQGAAGWPGATAAGDQPTAGVDSAAAAGDKQQPEPAAGPGCSSGEGARQPSLGRATGEVGGRERDSGRVTDKEWVANKLYECSRSGMIFFRSGSGSCLFYLCIPGEI
jgi:hypothetical protein